MSTWKHFIGLILALMICLGLFVYFTARIITSVEENGLKNIISDIWEGTNADTTNKKVK